MKSHLASLALCLALCACAAPSQRIGIPEGYVGDIVQLSAVVRPSPFGVLAGEAFCSVTSMDGSKMGLEYFFPPGTHSLRVRLTNMGHNYDGTIQLTFNAPGKYELFVKREGDRFDISSKRVPSGEVVEVASMKASSYTPVTVPIIVK